MQYVFRHAALSVVNTMTVFFLFCFVFFFCCFFFFGGGGFKLNLLVSFIDISLLTEDFPSELCLFL